MDFLTILGLLVALCAILVGQFLDGGTLLSLFNPAALIIVLGGTLGAVMVETPFQVFSRALKILPWAFFPPKRNIEALSQKIVQWSSIARKHGLLALESVLRTEQDPIVKKGIGMLLDGANPEIIKKTLTIELLSQEKQDMSASKVFESMGGYAPTIGIIGAALGLIHVMGNLSEPEKLGAGIAVAFVATIYGVGFANIIFIPLSIKLQSTIEERSILIEALIDGISSISDGENPYFVKMKMNAYEQTKS